MFNVQKTGTAHRRVEEIGNTHTVGGCTIPATHTHTTSLKTKRRIANVKELSSTGVYASSSSERHIILQNACANIILVRELFNPCLY